MLFGLCKTYFVACCFMWTSEPVKWTRINTRKQQENLDTKQTNNSKEHKKKAIDIANNSNFTFILKKVRINDHLAKSIDIEAA